MEYPRLNNWLVFQRAGPDGYRVTDFISDETFTMGWRIAQFARRLDGKTDPYSISADLSEEEVHNLLVILEQNGLLRHDGFLVKSFGTVYRTLWIPKITPSLRAAAFLCNLLLRLLWIPLLLTGVLAGWLRFPEFSGGYVLAGYFGGFLAGLVLHEFGHAFACLSSGGRLFEMGVMVRSFLPGAYVLIDTRGVKSCMKRVQIFAAGIQMNLLLAGLSLLLGAVFPGAGDALFGSAVANIIVALMNLILLDGFDGMAILSELLGIDDPVSDARRVLCSGRLRQRLRKRGLSGTATIALGLVIALLQIALPLLYLVSILEVIGCLL